MSDLRVSTSSHRLGRITTSIRLVTNTPWTTAERIVINIKPTSQILRCGHQPSYQARYQPSGSPVGSALMLIPGLILKLMADLVPPLAWSHIFLTLHSDLKVITSTYSHSSAIWCFMANASMWYLPSNIHKGWFSRYYYKETNIFQL